MLCKSCNVEIPENSVFCNVCGKRQTKAETRRNVKTRGNGTGSAYKLPNGKWRAAHTVGYDENNKRIYKTKSGFKTKKEALEYLHTLKNDDKPPKTIKFSVLFKEWSVTHFSTISKGKINHYTTAYNKCEPLHYKNITDIRTKDIQAVIDSDPNGYYPKHDIKVLCGLMFKYAIQNDYAQKNYAEFVRLPPVPKSKREAFNENEVNALWADYNAGNDFTGYILILIYTGMRIGELQKIKKDNVFLDEGYIIGGIKTEAGIDRQIIIHRKIKHIVERYYHERKNNLLEMCYSVFCREYYAVLERIGARKLSPHCCRHTCVTLLVSAGITPEIIKSVVGHEDYQTTLQYTHIPLDEKLKAVNKIE